MKKKLFNLIAIAALCINGWSIPTDGLVAHWPFNGNAEDVAGINDGIVNGATLTADRFGNANQAYYFDGSSNISIIFEDTLDINTTSSIMIWFKAEEVQMSYAKMLTVPFRLDTWTNPYHFMAFSYNMYDGFTYANFDTLNGLCETASYEDGNTNWNLASFITDNGEISVYINGIYKGGINCTNRILPEGSTMSIGSRSTSATNNGEYYTGIIDDIAIYDRALSASEILTYYQGCTTEPDIDTTTYYISDIDFETKSGAVYLESADTLQNQEGCDSLVLRYTEFIYEADYATPCIQNMDTLVIDVTITALEAPFNRNFIEVYPNPASDIVYINTGALYQEMADYKIKIASTTGSVVFETAITEAQFSIDVNDFGQTGLFLVQILDKNGQVAAVKYLLLQ